MPESEEFEKSIYTQRLTHKAWLNRAIARGATPTPEQAELVWELLVAYAEALENFARAQDYIYKAAYELGTLLLHDLSLKRIFAIYRDRLVEAMMNSAGEELGGQCREIVGFSNILSSAYADAQIDSLKKESLHDRVIGLSRELKVAKRIQMHLLPKRIPILKGFDFAGRLLPAEEIGGDYWSIRHRAEDGITTLKLADITGHGVAAATLVAAVKFISGGYYHGAASAAEVVQKTNRVLTLETPHDILVTMAYGWLRPATYELSIVNAGHAPVFICRRDSFTDIPLTGPVLGASEDATYGEETFKLAKHDVVFFGSDGITEAGTIHPFGLSRLKKVVSDNFDRSADQIADAVLDAVTKYVPNPHDDISMIVVKVTGDPPKDT